MKKIKSDTEKNEQAILDTSSVSPRRVSLLIFVFTLILIIGISFFIYRQGRNNERKVLIINERARIQAMYNYVRSELRDLGADLKIVSSHADFKDYFSTGEQKALDDLANEFYHMSYEKEKYDQIRFLNTEGEEVVRVNYNNGNPVIVASEDLQNKKGRYYFDNTYDLNPGDVYVSPLDLNIENGQIEQPLKPMIRIGTPIANGNGEKEGIVLLNYFGDEFLKRISDFYQGGESRLLLVNQDGYWIKGMRAEDEWGFMYENKTDRKIQTSYPDLWKEISQKTEGQFENSDGLFTYQRIYPVDYIAWNISNREDASIRLENEEYAWVVLSFVPKEIITFSSNELLGKIQWINLLIILLIGLLVWRLYVVMRYRQRAEKTILELNDLMRIINKILRHDILGKLASIRYSLEASELVDKNEMVTDAFNVSLDGVALVNNMRELERSFSIDKPMEKIMLGQVLKDVAKEQGIKITIRGDEEVSADSALNSVFENIMRNAKIHGGVKSLTVDIEKKDAKVIVKIADKGKGIDEDVKDNLFEEGVKSKSTGHTGIGLYVTKKTIERYGGTIRAEANKPKGTVFIIEFPT